MKNRIVETRCASCCNVFHPRVQDVERSVKSRGKWRCKPCATTERNKALARPIGSTRIHAQSGYVEQKTDRGWVRQHIVVAEARLGRRLTRDEIVHHANEVKSDNSDGNLLILDRGEHTALHHTGMRRTDEQLARITEAIRRSARTKLTLEAVEEIKAQVSIGVPQRQLARTFGVSPMTINRVATGATWR